MKKVVKEVKRMYTYGYIKNAILTKLNLTEKEALEQNLLDTFIYNINECLSQIASTIKPNFATKQVTVYEKEIPIPQEMVLLETDPVDVRLEKEEALKKYLDDKTIVGKLYEMPKDFIAFSGVPTFEEEQCMPHNIVDTPIYLPPKEVHDEVVHIDRKNILFKKPGIYQITYDGWWPTFNDEMQDADELDIPSDVVICIPSYVASQVWKIDDERKANIFRNEFEIFFSRINNSDYRGVQTFGVRGGW